MVSHLNVMLNLTNNKVFYSRPLSKSILNLYSICHFLFWKYSVTSWRQIHWFVSNNGNWVFLGLSWRRVLNFDISMCLKSLSFLSHTSHQNKRPSTGPDWIWIFNKYVLINKDVLFYFWSCILLFILVKTRTASQDICDVEIETPVFFSDLISCNKNERYDATKNIHLFLIDQVAIVTVKDTDGSIKRMLTWHSPLNYFISCSITSDQTIVKAW